MKMRDLYLTNATVEKIKDMPMEQVKLYSLNARTIREAYDYLWTMMANSDRIEKIEYDPADESGGYFLAMPRLQKIQFKSAWL